MKKIMVIVLMFILIFSMAFVIADNDDDSENGSDDSISGNSDNQIEYEKETEIENGEIKVKEKAEIQYANGTRVKHEYELRERHELNEQERERILRKEHELRIRSRLNSSDCPNNCSCTGSTIKCEFADQNGTRREMTIHAGNSGNIIFQVKGYNASTNVTLYKAEDGKVYAHFRNNETREIILPDEARDRIEAELRERVRLHNENITLDEEGEYEIRAEKRARLFFIIPVRERIEAQVDAETGEIIRQRNPWWGFLARDVPEDLNETSQ